MPATAVLSADQTHVQFPGWAARSGLLHGTTTRPALPTFGADQVHGAAIGIVDAALQPSRQPEGLRWDAALQIGEFAATDALVTNQPGVLLAIQTADCLPVFLLDTHAGVFAIAHCGWKGLDQGLAGATARAMFALGAAPGRIEAWLGPCIQPANYEVSADLVERFAAACPGGCIAPDGRHLDLPAVGRWQLEQAGLLPAAVVSSNECTLRQSDRYHSYRADADRSGRMLSFMALN
jgi:YfiH family protein